MQCGPKTFPPQQNNNKKKNQKNKTKQQNQLKRDRIVWWSVRMSNLKLILNQTHTQALLAITLPNHNATTKWHNLTTGLKKSFLKWIFGNLVEIGR